MRGPFPLPAGSVREDGGDWRSTDMRYQWFALGLAVWAAAVLSISALAAPRLDADATCCDHLFYRAMAGGPQEIPPGNRLPAVYADPDYGRWMHPENGLAQQPPYVYRPLAPLLARALGWYPLTLISLAAAAWLLGLAAWRVTGRTWAGVLAVALFAVDPWLSQVPLAIAISVDPLAHAFCALGVLLILRRDTPALALPLLVAVGLFAKESVGWLLPCWLLTRWQPRRLIFSALAVLPYLAFRLSVPVPVDTYSLATTWVPWPRPELLTGTVLAFGALWLAVPHGLRAAPRLAVLLPLLVGGWVMALFAGNVERAVVYAYPLIILCACALAVRLVSGQVPRVVRHKLRLVGDGVAVDTDLIRPASHVLRA